MGTNVGDQFTAKNAHLVTRIFQIFYFIINFGSFFASLLTPWLFKRYGPAVAFGVPGVLMAVATLVFWLGRRKFVHVPARPGGKLGLLDFLASSLLASPLLVLVAVGATVAEVVVRAAMGHEAGAVAAALRADRGRLLAARPAGRGRLRAGRGAVRGPPTDPAGQGVLRRAAVLLAPPRRRARRAETSGRRRAPASATRPPRVRPPCCASSWCSRW